jgi:hypothetical protein
MGVLTTFVKLVKLWAENFMQNAKNGVDPSDCSLISASADRACQLGWFFTS